MPRHPKPAKTANQKQTEHSMRIIGGKWRSRKVTFHSADGLRPTGDRIRETLFNWLSPHIIGANCVDLFAGSGALGFEALSRGAKSCSFIEAANPVCRKLKEQGALLDCDNAEFINQSAFDYLQQNTDGTAIDILFIDPPFAENMHDQVLELALANPRVTEDTLIYIESPREWSAAMQLEPIKEKQAGGVRFSLNTPKKATS